MGDWLSFLIFAGLFYVMMRYGCGAHMIHGRHGHHDKAKDIDPVCGMEINIEQGYGKMHEGWRCHMNARLSLRAIGHASSLFLAISYVLCVVFDLVFPEYAMHTVWHKLLPGFEWISWKGFIIGLVESYGYGWFFTLIWTPLYNVFAARN